MYYCGLTFLGPWTAEEDAALIIAMHTYGIHWSKVALQMGTRSVKQCRERWIHHLDPEVSKKDYSPEEDTKLLELHATLGNKWADIARSLTGRTVSICFMI